MRNQLTSNRITKSIQIREILGDKNKLVKKQTINKGIGWRRKRPSWGNPWWECRRRGCSCTDRDWPRPIRRAPPCPRSSLSGASGDPPVSMRTLNCPYSLSDFLLRWMTRPRSDIMKVKGDKYRYRWEMNFMQWVLQLFCFGRHISNHFFMTLVVNLWCWRLLISCYRLNEFDCQTMEIGLLIFQTANILFADVSVQVMI